MKIFMLRPKLMIVLFLSLMAWSIQARADKYDRGYEQRAQEIVNGLERVNGLAGWIATEPSGWPHSAEPNEDYHQPSRRQAPGVVWVRGAAPASLAALNLVNLNLQRVADLSRLPHLKRLELSGNALTGLNVDGNAELVHLSALKNQLGKLRLSGCPQLTHLALSGNRLASLDVSANTRLRTLVVSMNGLTSLDVSRQSELADLEAMNNQLTSLSVAANPALTRLQVSYNALPALDVSANRRLEELGVRDNRLSHLNVSRNEALANLSAGRNRLTALDLSRNPALTRLSIEQNLLASLDISHNPALEILEVQDNPMAEIKLGNNELNRLHSLNVDGCRLPLTSLALLAGKARNRGRLGAQTDVLFERRRLALDEVLDLSAEAVIEDVPTVFTVLNEKKRRLRPSDYGENGGVIIFKRPGIYYVEMTNDRVVSHEINRTTGRTRQFKAKARTGAVEVALHSDELERDD